MIIDVVEMLYEFQNRAFRTALHVVIDQLKSRIHESKGTTTELMKTLAYSQADVRDLQSEVRVLLKFEKEKKKNK